MDLRQLFTHKTWWGKLIGAFFGFIILGPTGALFGILIGNFFDRGLSSHFSQPFFYYLTTKNPKVRRIFFESMFRILGHIAKADGSVSPKGIDYTTNIMVQMKLSSEEIKQAQTCFHQGKSIEFHLPTQLSALRQAIQYNSNLVNLFVETQYQAIRKTGVSAKKMMIMDQILAYLQLAPLYRHARAYDGFQSQSHHYSPPPGAEKQQHRAYSHQEPAMDDPYALLNIKPGASLAEVKRAYRRQVSLHHPDKLIAKGASASRIKMATERTQQIRRAYEHICKTRS